MAPMIVLRIRRNYYDHNAASKDFDSIEYIRFDLSRGLVHPYGGCELFISLKANVKL